VRAHSEREGNTMAAKKSKRKAAKRAKRPLAKPSAKPKSAAKREEISSDLRRVALAHALRRLK
jgi:hypothetical protein